MTTDTALGVTKRVVQDKSVSCLVAANVCAELGHCTLSYSSTLSDPIHSERFLRAL